MLAVSLGAGPRAQAQSKDEQAIRALEDQFIGAFNAKDADAIMKVYAPGDDLFVFDRGIPPRQYVGWEDCKKDWQDYISGYAGADQG